MPIPRPTDASNAIRAAGQEVGLACSVAFGARIERSRNGPKLPLDGISSSVIVLTIEERRSPDSARFAVRRSYGSHGETWANQVDYSLGACLGISHLAYPSSGQPATYTTKASLSSPGHTSRHSSPMSAPPTGRG